MYYLYAERRIVDVVASGTLGPLLMIRLVLFDPRSVGELVGPMLSCTVLSMRVQTFKIIDVIKIHHKIYSKF